MTALRARLHERRRMIGTVLALPGAALAELAAAPFDLVWIDLEHGALDLPATQDMAIGAQAAGAAVAVRIPRWDWDRLGAVLDAGVDGIVVPAAESAEQVADVCARLRHPPAGVRGFGPRRAGRYARARESPPPACIVQIETPGGVTAAGEIAAVPGVDALVLGCSDLSLRLGLPPRLDSPQLVDAAAALRATGTAFGVAGAGPPAALARLAGPDGCLLICSTDIRLYAQAVDDVAAGLRSAYEVLHA